MPALGVQSVLISEAAMLPADAVAELMEMRRKVVREMPHVNCRPMQVGPGYFMQCTCYKQSLKAALIRAEIDIRNSLGMDPF